VPGLEKETGTGVTKGERYERGSVAVLRSGEITTVWLGARIGE